MRERRNVWVVLALAVFVVAGVANALPVTQIRSSEIGTSSIVIGFESIADDGWIVEDVVTIDGATFGGGSVVADGVSMPCGFAHAGVNSYFDTQFGPITVAFASPVDRVGAWFVSAPGVGDLSIEAFDATGVSLGSITGTLPGDGGLKFGCLPTGFIGLSATTPISSIAIHPDGQYQFGIDDLRYRAYTSAPPVPEPGTALILGGGLLGLALSRKRAAQRKRRRGRRPRTA